MSQPERGSSKLDIYTMPLTHVSIEYGTEGLEHRLQHTLGKIGLQDHELIQESIRLGLDLHRDDSRTYEPYNNHLLRVTLRLIEDLGIIDPLTIAAAPLHDSVEDHPDELIRRYLEVEVPQDQQFARELGYEGLQLFAAEYDAQELADIVLAVSNPLLLPGESKIHSYVAHVRMLMQHGPARPRLIKIADILDNVDVPRGLERPEKREQLDEKQLPIYPLARDGLTHPEGNVSDDARDQALDTLASRRRDAIERIDQVSRRKSA
jgi:(p)ppGpp synthase/HD superfamily hydrolase